MKTSINDISKESIKKINELIDQGWQFMLNYGPPTFGDDNEDFVWEVDFTRKLPSGLYDNHVNGVSKDINEAIDQAYNNIKNGVRLKG